MTPPPPPAALPTSLHDASDLPTIQFEPNAPRSQADSVDSLIAQFEVSRQQSDANIGRDLKAMIGLEPTPPPPSAASPREGDVDALLALSGEPSAPMRRAPRASGHEQPSPPPRRSPPPSTRPPPRRAVSGSGADLRPATSRAVRAEARTGEQSVPVVSVERSSDRQLPTGPSKIKRSSRASLSGEGRRRGSGAWIVVFALVALALAGAAVWRLKPGFLSGRTQEKVDAERAANEAERRRVVAQHEAQNCRATLVITDVPLNAEVLQRVGQAPVDVEQMPVGTRLEFVATAETYAPKRTVVPSGATWDSGPDGKPRFEVAVQLEKSRAKPGGADLWPAADPGIAVGGDGPPGTVRIVSTPKGAEVWLLVGASPEARIEHLKCGTDVEVLVAGPTALRKRLHIPQADFASAETDPKSGASIRTARLSAK